MRQVLTLIVLAFFATGSALNLRCLFSCAPLHRAAESAESCHHSTDSAQKISELGDCGAGLTQPPALIGKRSDPGPSLLVAAIAAISLGQPWHDLSSTSETTNITAAGPPQPFLLIPLRI